MPTNLFEMVTNGSLELIQSASAAEDRQEAGQYMGMDWAQIMGTYCTNAAALEKTSLIVDKQSGYFFTFHYKFNNCVIYC